MGILDTFKRKKTTKEPASAKAAAAKKSKAVKPAAKPVSSKPAAMGKPASDAKELVMAHVLLQPASTEKSFRLQAQNKYVFYVAVDANKHQVRMAVKETYGSEPQAVHMVRIKPQTVYRWGRAIGTQKAVKKAIVTMPAGTTLPLTAK